MPIGPSLPPHLAHLNKSTTPPREDESDEDDSFGPALPPHLAAARKQQQQQQAEAGPSRPMLESPSPPRISRQLREQQHEQKQEEEDESDDDIIGPVLPTDNIVEKSAVEQFLEREQRMQQEKISETDKKPQREEWMLVPPSSGILSAATDPLRKRPTTFSRNAQQVEVDHSLWTETPAEKMQRLKDEAAGIKRKKPGNDDDSVDRERKRIRDEEIRKEVEKHNKGRGKSLLEQHASKDKSKEDAPAIWDHARDMGVTGRLLNDQERSQKIRDAKNLNDRFGHSKRGAYDM